MELIEIILISVGLGMDAFAVAICKGVSFGKMDWKKAGIVGLYFGGFQAFMPLIGFLIGAHFQNIVESIDHWIAFVLLTILGGNMLKSACQSSHKNCNNDIRFQTMFGLAIATSIDALTVGITLAFLKVNLLLAVSFIGIITFLLSILGVKIGNVFGDKYEKKAEMAGGCILILMGVKILLEHLKIL